MLFRPNPSSGVPIYLQLMEQVKHAIETGRPAARRAAAGHPAAGGGAGDQSRTPSPRPTASSNTKASSSCGTAPARSSRPGAARRRLTDKLRAGQTIVATAVEKLRARGVTDEEIRRLFEAELAGLDEGREDGRTW